MAKLILTFNGGGVRGVIGVTFLSLLEEKLLQETGKGLYESFDMFMGTSIGGIVVTLISILKLKAESLEKEVFTHDNIVAMMPDTLVNKIFGIFQLRPEYDGVGKRKVISDVLKKYANNPNMLLDSAEKPTMVTTYDVERRKAKILKSHQKHNIKALDAMDATSAAPIYYPNVEVASTVNDKHKTMFLIDGGMVCNKPTIAAYSEARLLWPIQEIRILDIGTGTCINAIDGKKSKRYGLFQWMKNGFMQLMFDDTIIDYEARAMLGKNYMRVTSDLPAYVSHQTNDISQSNFDGMKRLGREWFDVHGEEVIKFIKG